MTEVAKSTIWEVTGLSLRGTHKIWSRVRDGEALFLVLPHDQYPGVDDGGYFSVDAALKQKGMR